MVDDVMIRIPNDYKEPNKESNETQSKLYDLLIRKLEFMKYIMDNHVSDPYKKEWIGFINDVNKTLDEIK